MADVFDGPHATPRTVEAGPIFLGISALQDGAVNLSETRHVTEDDFKKWTRRVRPTAGDIVFSYETRLGQAAIIPEGLECCLGRRMGLVRFRDGQVIPRFFLYQYLSPQFRAFLDANTIRGATVDRISIKDFPSFPIDLPPLPEQQRILTILDNAFAGLATAAANAETNLKNARELFDSYLNSIFTSRDGEWAEKSLRDVSIEFGRGKSKHRPRNDPALYDGKYPFVQTGDIRNSGGVITEYSQTYNEAGLAQSKLWPKGTICITIAANIAETGILTFDACFPDSIIGMVVDPALTNNKFVEYLLRFFKAVLKAQGKGSAQDNINLATFENRKFPFPPIKIQDMLAAKLDSVAKEVERLELLYHAKLKSVSELKQAILQVAFCGELVSPPSRAIREAAE
ncbi:type I restriction enzyme S subunit [Bradyrhizobium japonicum]